MKISVDTRSVKDPRIILAAENLEEKQLLMDIWARGADRREMHQLGGNCVELVLAPAPEVKR